MPLLMLLSAIIFSLLGAGPVFSRDIRFSVASYNVENLFDLKTAGTEYPEYMPNGPFGWNKAVQSIKVSHIARSIHDLDADIICLEEIESAQALEDLKKALEATGAGYPYSAIADGKPTTVRCAVLSRFPIIEKKEVTVPGKKSRSILWVTLDISGRHLIVFVNHWKSKNGPESARMPYAETLQKVLSRLPPHCDYILAGDFNENYNEFSTILLNRRLNDTNGVTGINRVLKTVQGGRLVDENALIHGTKAGLHYNLWLELREKRRWSILFFGKKGTPDSIILPKSMYDDRGISYLDNSFDKFDPEFLFSCGDIFRWQLANSGRGRHLGRGYSDHLPVFACFTTRPFEEARGFMSCDPGLKNTTIAGLYESKTGAVNLKLNDCTVIFRNRNNAVIKEKNGRAIYIYKTASKLRAGRCYDIIVTRLNRHFGNMEITAIKKAIDTGRSENPQNYWIKIKTRANLSDPALINEVVGRCTGIYKNGFLHTKKGRFPIYFSNPALRPAENNRITIMHARISCHRIPELVVERADQVSLEP
ncbi:MAG: hypothetical protein GXP53_00410 [Deltaproteobacteria bacterium]|nr:hypothetical protein [Deltaproteobacteria bacterium]